MGKISKGVKCSITDCNKDAVRSMSIDKVAEAGFKVEGKRRVYLCKTHYKEYKKATRKNNNIERWRQKGRLS